MIADGDDRAAAVDALTTAAEQAGDADLTHALPDPARALLVEPDRVIGADLDAFTDRCGGEAVSALVGVIDLLASVHHGAGNIDTANALTDAAAHIEYTASDHARDARHA